MCLCVNFPMETNINAAIAGRPLVRNARWDSGSIHFAFGRAEMILFFNISNILNVSLKDTHTLLGAFNINVKKYLDDNQRNRVYVVYHYSHTL